MRACEIMAAPVVVISEDSTLEQAAWLMLDRRVGCLPVVDEHGCLTGIVSRSDFVAKDSGVRSPGFRAPGLLGHWLSRQGLVEVAPLGSGREVREVMTAHVHAVQEDDSVAAVVRLMLGQRLRRVPVLRGHVPVGVISRHDILRLVLLESVAREPRVEPRVSRGRTQGVAARVARLA